MPFFTDTDPIHRRGRSIEDAFFHDVDRKLLSRLRTRDDRQTDRRRLMEAGGLDDSPLIDELLDAGFSAANIAALTLLPAVVVAWADGNVTTRERRLILHEAFERDVRNHPLAMQLVRHWLERRVPPELWDVWQDYALEVYQRVGPANAAILADSILDAATRVAKASGGLFDRGKISEAEQIVLTQIAETR